MPRIRHAARLAVSYERGTFSTDHWSATLDGGLAKRLDYAFDRRSIPLHRRIRQ